MQGATAGSSYVTGTSFVQTAFSYEWINRWRNFGIIVVITFSLLVAHLVMSEVVASERSKGEVLVFRRSKMKFSNTKRLAADEESGRENGLPSEKYTSSDLSDHAVQKQVSIFHWQDVNYEIQTKGERRIILDSVDGWIKPGTLTALMVCRHEWNFTMS